MPFYHCFGMVMGNLGCTTHGATMVIPAPGFDPGLTLAAIEQERCTGVYGVPTMFIAMLSHPDFGDRDLSSLRTGIMAGSACPVEVMKRCMNEMNMTEVAIAYGMTETSPASCQTLIDDDLERRTATVGRALPHVEIKVVDPETGETVERGQPGEFCTRGYSLMLGYWNDDEKTREAIDADGWMHTGDLAVMREDGYCNIVGRIKDMVIRGGENVYPREVEEFLYTHPDIEDAQVIGVPDDKYGEEICAWIRMKPGRAPLDAEAVRAFATGKLAHYKIPRYVHVVDEFPMTITGKVRKVEMREESGQTTWPRSEGWGFVVGGEPGLAFLFFLGDEFGAFAAFGVDAVTAVLVAGLLAPRHHCRTVGDRLRTCRRDIQLTGGLPQRGKHTGAVRLGAVDMSGRSRQHDSAVRQLLIDPTTRATAEGFIR